MASFTYQFDLDKRLVTVFQEILGLSRVDADNTKQQLAGYTQGKRLLLVVCSDGV